MDANTPVICLEKTPEYFSRMDWTTQISLIGLDNFAFTRRRFLASWRGLNLTYYRRTDPEGGLASLTTCFEFGSCQREALIGHYILTYDVQETALADWDTTDRELAALVDSWAVP